MKFPVAIAICMAVFFTAATAGAAREPVWYWSPEKMEDAIRPQVAAMHPTNLETLRCVGYGTSTYAEDDTQLFNRFKCRIRSLGRHLVTRVEIISTRATSRFSYVVIKRTG
jgi:hypothetical protein